MADPVVVTASAGSFRGLVDALRALDVPVQEHPLLTFVPPGDWAAVDDAVGRLADFEAVAVTSPRASAAFAGRLGNTGARKRGLARPRFWASGAATAAPLRAVVGDVRVADAGTVGERGAGVALANAMLAAGVRGPVLFPCGEMRRDELPAMLQARGVEVEPAICYRTQLAADAEARSAVERAGILVVASPGVADLVARVSSGGPRPALLAVGPTTAAAARASGWVPAAVASEPTGEALIAAVRELLAEPDPEFP